MCSRTGWRRRRSTLFCATTGVFPDHVVVSSDSPTRCKSCNEWLYSGRVKNRVMENACPELTHLVVGIFLLTTQLTMQTHMEVMKCPSTGIVQPLHAETELTYAAADMHLLIVHAATVMYSCTALPFGAVYVANDATRPTAALGLRTRTTVMARMGDLPQGGPHCHGSRPSVERAAGTTAAATA